MLNLVDPHFAIVNYRFSFAAQTDSESGAIATCGRKGWAEGIYVESKLRATGFFLSLRKERATQERSIAALIPSSTASKSDSDNAPIRWVSFERSRVVIWWQRATLSTGSPVP